MSSSGMLCVMLRDEQQNARKTYYQNNKELIKKKRRMRYIQQKADGEYVNQVKSTCTHGKYKPQCKDCNGNKYKCYCCNQVLATSTALKYHNETIKHKNNLLRMLIRCDCFTPDKIPKLHSTGIKQ
jgi:hypothetical protein